MTTKVVPEEVPPKLPSVKTMPHRRLDLDRPPAVLGGPHWLITKVNIDVNYVQAQAVTILKLTIISVSDLGRPQCESSMS